MSFISRLSTGTLLLALGSLALSARPVRAQVLVLDQSNIVGSAGGFFDGALLNSQSIAQTFTVGVAGQLSQVGFQVYHNAGAPGDLTLQILSTSGGVPNPTSVAPLFQTVVPLANTPTFASVNNIPVTLVDVSSANITVNPGQVLTIALRSPNGSGSPPWTLWRAQGNTYAGGAEYTSSGTTWNPQTNIAVGQDLGFQTFVTAAVPEPGSIALLAGISTVGVAFLRRRKQASKSA